jgi:hypothetical protein
MPKVSIGSIFRNRSDWAFRRRLQEIDKFFEGADRVHQTMRHVANYLQSAGIRYAIVGGMAVNAHRHQRTTRDVDFLLTAEGFAAFRKIADAGEFEAMPGRPRRFTDRTTNITFDVLISGHFPGSGEPGPISFPDPAAVTQDIDNLHVVDLPTLVQLKLAARRYQDFADVVSLIRANALDESFQDRLHAAMRADFIECIEEKRREDECEARQDRAVEGGP